MNIELSKYQKFNIETINRRDIKNAPYNPRKISDSNRNKLTKIIKKKGLLLPLLINKATGNLVSGHQRLSILDNLHSNNEYKLTVAVINMNEREEKEANIILNNASITGEWDTIKLENIFKEIDFKDVGFELNELNVLDIEISSIFDDINETHKTKQTIEELKNIKKGFRDKANESNSDKRLLVVVFDSESSKQEILSKLNIDTESKYLSEEVFLSLIKKDKQ